jgi:hypothetical protein
LASRAVVRMVPPPNSSGADTTLSVHVELAAADLPWRFTPQLPVGQHLRPWIVLVVGTAQEPGVDGYEIELLGDDRIRLRSPVLADQPLAEAARWAHVQIALDGEFNLSSMTNSQLEALIQTHGGRPVARLLSPRPLVPNRRHIAALVPAFQPDGRLSWDGSTQGDVVLPVYRHWQFRTGSGGDFRTLAARLRARLPDPDGGRASLTYDRLDPPEDLGARGALGPVGGGDSAVSAAISQDLDQLGEPPADPRGRPVIGLPIYGAAWQEDPKGTAWGGSANTDPRHRGAAGLGADAAIELQDTIVDAVKAQIGAVSVAAHRINQLVAGLQAARGLWNQRLPANPRHRLLLYGPSMRRIVSQNGPVLGQVTGGERPMPPALFSTAARRILRPGPARTALAQPAATLPEAILEEANTCLPLPDPRPTNGIHVDDVSDELGLPPLAEVLGKIGQVEFDAILEALNEYFKDLPANIQSDQVITSFWRNLVECINYALGNELSFDFIRLGELLVLLFDPNVDLAPFRTWNCEEYLFPPDASWDELEEGLDNGPPDRPCRPVDLDRLEDDLTSAIDPTVPNPWIVDLVLEDIEGLPDPPLAPAEVCTGVDLPAWRFLRDRHAEWLLPGRGQLEADGVYAFESNPVFVDAFLLGLNTQVLGELRWRNVPIATGCTPLKMFWGRLKPGATEPASPLVRVNDIRDVGNWTATSSLGDPSHNPASDVNANLVLVVRSDLFVRYPATLVSAVPAVRDANGNPLWGPANKPPETAVRSWPIFQGSLGQDMTFFGFDLTPAEARNYWVVLEEPSSGYRFRNDGSNGSNGSTTATNGAGFAAATLNVPTRVLISGAELIPE